MSTRLRSIGAVLGIVVGCLGIGMVAAESWLWKHAGRTTATVPGVAVPASSPTERCTATEQFSDFLRDYRRIGRGDPRGFGRRMYACAVEHGREQAYTTMLRDAMRKGDSIARLALDGVARTACDTHAVLSGATVTQAGSTCVDVIGLVNSGVIADASDRERVMRIAQRASVLRVGASLPSFIVTEFCADLVALPPRIRDRLLAKFPDLEVVRTEYCATSTAVLLPSDR
ncbi:hypothetical protein HY632_05015 [Candidatus Uhrbacteria bacterium]|nr:hypothetical protein [Candidatus Uhrbacteria bacterium]